MTFNSFPFLVFFILVWIIYLLLWNAEQKRFFLSVSSVLFYAFCDLRFLPLFAGFAVFNYFAAKKIENSADIQKKVWFYGASCADLGILFFFKYCNFFLDSTFGALRILHVTSAMPPVFHVILPLGISFYTFQTIGYLVDVYGEVSSPGAFSEFFCAVTFFPSVMSGPIMRSDGIFPQIENLKGPDFGDVIEGVLLITAGILKKCVADWLGLTADYAFNSSRSHLTALEAWTGAFAFMGQVYGDFSGYTDMAIGIARLFGIKLPANFNSPFLATSVADYWRRWHISLSEWFRDYVFTPLAYLLSKSGVNGTVIGTFVTMVVLGLWHGASWTYVAFGFYHGLLLVLTYYLARLFPTAAASTSRWFRYGKIILAYYLVLLGNVLFRSNSFSRAWNYISDLHSPGSVSYFDASVGGTFATVCLLVFFVYSVGYAVETRKEVLLKPAVAWGASSFFIVCGLLAYSVLLKVGVDFRTFIYFGF